ncbi:hypothetical protein AK812_SmicGene35049 [Symbiodinium microadriaticum]|uniref:Uncharacterized protein n=1 Tax=Symbiodinium microadriaticum TaxID=2951 RepID=A0A1Q9CMH0_SYMMI|nr:hypothetical protein AK812_SmicGene35049 [Symbiodinium microadriaticum]
MASLDGFSVDDEVEDERDPLDRAPRLPPLFSNPQLPLQHSKSEPALQLTGVVAGSEANPILQEEKREEEKEATEDADPPTATALEIIQVGNYPTSSLLTLLGLKPPQPGIRHHGTVPVDLHAASVRLRMLSEAAFRVGWWTVFLSLPISIWPIALKLQEVGSLQRVFLDFWGSMLLQFLFCVGSTLGVSVRYTLEGWLGTALATLNMLMLNNVGNWMAGGSYASRLEFNSTATNDTVVTSRWLPLCNTKADLSYHGCVLNLNTGLMEEAEYGKAAVVLMDTILFMAMMLFFGFNTNVRLFSISTHIYLAMSFLDPSTGAFDIQPSLATNYFIIVSISSLAVILCFLLPRPLTSTAQARSILLETGAAVAMILESLPLTSSELCRSKAQAAMGEMKTSMQNFDAVFCAAAAVPTKESEQMLTLLPSLRHQCCLVSSTLTALLAVKTPDEVKPVVDVLLEKREALQQQLAVDFPKGQQSDQLLLPPSLVFSLTLAGVVKDTCDSLSSLALYGLEEDTTRSRWWRSLQVIIYTFTGSSLPLTLRRLNGVVLGTVVGSIAQRLFAVQLAFRAVCFGLFQLVTVTVLILVNFQSKQHGSLALLTAAFAMSLAVKLTSADGSFLFAKVVGTFIGVAVLLLVDLVLSSSARRQSKQRLLRGLGRVSRFVKEVLDPEDIQHAEIEDVEKGFQRQVDSQAKIYEDLDELANLLPFAVDEPGALPFQADLFRDLEKGLRSVTRHFRTILWAIQILEKPQKRMTLRAGSWIFQAKAKAAQIKAEPVLRGELFRPILATLAEEIRLMLANMKVIVSGIYNKKDEEAEAVKDILRSKLYTKPVSRAFCRITRSPWRTAWKFAAVLESPIKEVLNDPTGPTVPKELPLLPSPDQRTKSDPPGLRRSASNPDLALHVGNTMTDSSSISPSRAVRGLQSLAKQKRALVKVAKQLRDEDLEEENPSASCLALPPVTALEKGGAKDGAADASALRLLLMFEKLREAASSRRADLPENDAFSTLELIIFFLSSVQTQIQQMQLSLLEYG